MHRRLELYSLAFDAETRELLGLDDIEEILGQVDEETDADVREMEEQVRAIQDRESPRSDHGSGEGAEESDPETG